MVMKASGGPSWTPEPDSGITVDFVEAGELTFEVAQAGEGDHLALMLHGFPELHYSWRAQMPVLAEMGYRVWAPNLRGYGGTSRPEGVENYTFEKLLGDVAALIDVSGAKKVTLFVHDWGGFIGWRFAILKVRPLERFIAMNIPHPLAIEKQRRNRNQLKKSWYILFFQIPWLPETVLGLNRAKRIGDIFLNTCCNPEHFPREVREVYRAAAARPGALRATINYYRALIKGRDVFDVGDGRVDVPTLKIFGEQDVAIDHSTLDGTEQWVPDFTLRKLPHASHWVQQDDPEGVNAILKDWLPRA